MFDKVKRTIAHHELIIRGDSILVGLSGGPDSVALLHILTRLRGKMKLTLTAIYINHGIRVRAAKEEERQCRDLCERLGVELIIVRENIPTLAAGARAGLEETARDFRYEVFERIADDAGHDRIALGHHTDDRVETILFRVLRGTGRTGLLGIPVARGRIVRPLYECTKQEIHSYLKKHKLAFSEDESNKDPQFARNYIRNTLLVDIRKRLNPAVDRALLNLSETAADEERFLQQVVSRAVRKCVRSTVGGKIALDLIIFRGYDIWLRRRLLRYCIAELLGPGQTLDKEVVDRIDRLGISGGKSISLPRGIQVVPAGGKLVVCRKRNRRFSHRLAPGKVCRLENLELNFRCRVESRTLTALKTERRARRVLIDHGKLTPPLVVRNINSGDRFRPLGMKGTKKVGDYLTDRKIPPVYRDEIPVVCDSAGIVWLAGFEIADRVKLDRLTEEVLSIEYYQRRENRAKAV